jgi:hypothetical protein
MSSVNGRSAVATLSASRTGCLLASGLMKTWALGMLSVATDTMDGGRLFFEDLLLDDFNCFLLPFSWLDSFFSYKN